MSERIDHAAEAREALKEAGDVRNFATDASASAIAHAMLALTEQQRIANLIALAAGGHGGPMGFEHEAMDALGVLGALHHLQLRPDIAASLGIGDDDE